MRKHPLLLLAILTAAPCFPSIVGATFSGEVTYVNDTSNFTQGLIGYGTPVTGEFMYEADSLNTCTPAAGCLVDTSHLSTFDAAGYFVIQLHLSGGGTLDFAHDPALGGLYVLLSDRMGNAPYQQEFELDGLTSVDTAPAGFGTPWIGLLLHSTLPEAFLNRHDLYAAIDYSHTDDATLSPSFTGYSGIYYSPGNGNGYQIGFRLDQIQQYGTGANGPVPEAGTGGYLALGLALVLAARRMRAKLAAAR